MLKLTRLLRRKSTFAPKRPDTRLSVLLFQMRRSSCGEAALASSQLESIQKYGESSDAKATLEQIQKESAIEASNSATAFNLENQVL